MESTSKRPASVWLTQIITAIGITIGVVSIPNRLWALILCVLGTSPYGCSGMHTTGLVRDIVIWGVLVVTFWGLQKRKLYGRKLGIGILVLMILVGVAESSYIQLLAAAIFQGHPLPSPPYECWNPRPGQFIQDSCGYVSYAELGFQVMMDLLFPGIPLAVLALKLATSSRANHFFGVRSPTQT